MNNVPNLATVIIIAIIVIVKIILFAASLLLNFWAMDKCSGILADEEAVAFSIFCPILRAIYIGVYVIADKLGFAP